MRTWPLRQRRYPPVSLKYTAMSCFGALAFVSGATKFVAKKYGGCGSIFMLHSVVPDETILTLENVHTKVSFLERSIRYFIKKKIAIVSLSDALSRIQSGSNERFVCFTFDDGYRDNLTHALPIFKKYGAPMTIYVTSAFLQRRYQEYSWGQLRHLVMDHTKTIGDALPARLDMGSASEKIRAYQKLSHWIRNGTLDQGRLETMFGQHHVTVSDCLDRDAFSFSELAEAAHNEPLLEIGAHTQTHPRLASLDGETVECEMRENRACLEKIVEREIRHFAYPYGDRHSCGEREFEVAKLVGFETAVTTRIGNLFPNHAQHRWSLPRLRFIGPCETLGFIESQRSGIVTAVETAVGRS
jgi:peptidoglycan/xylan/chitin deacetylase (PgdA/CDA1 family)